MIRNYLPRMISAPLWGDRQHWGLEIIPDDPCWLEWQQTYLDFYNANQRKGVGTIVNDAGYRIMKSLDLNRKTVLEIGAGDIRHIRFWESQPKEFILADISDEMMEKAKMSLIDFDIKFQSFLLDRKQPIPLENHKVDVIISFYSLEHLYPLQPYIQEIHRVLKPGGVLIGAIPAEGGLAWGLGRFFTSRRWFKRNTTIDPDKIICWEHPNYADEIINELDKVFIRDRIEFWPFNWLPLIDPNLIIRYIYRK